MEDLIKCYCGHTTTCDCGPEEFKQEKIYSEEEVMTILYCFHYDLVNSNIDTKEEWFEQFKKK
jgi:hypothetical protein